MITMRSKTEEPMIIKTVETNSIEQGQTIV